MLFSVIVPIYKVEKYLRQCVDSILAQTFSDFELILVDDGSPDCCPKICDCFAQNDDRVRVIHKINEGVAKARQTGVEIAKGNYVVFVDGDDTIEPECLEILSKYSDVDIIRFGYYYETGKGVVRKTMPERKGYYNKKDIVNDIYPRLIQTQDAKYFLPNVWGGAFRTELFKSNMLKDIRLAIGEDSACVMPCVYNAENMVILEECLYFYRLNLSSITKGRKVFQWDAPEIIANHLKSKLDIAEFDFQEQLYRKIVHELFSVVVSQFYRKAKNGEIKRNINRNLENPVYKEAIEKAKFKGSLKANLMHFALKHRCFALIKLDRLIR